MRAAVISAPGGPEVLQIKDLPIPEPAADQIRVRIHAAGLNRADLGQRSGNYPAPAGWPAQIPGLEFAGVVDACGPDVYDAKEGDRVFGIAGGGTHAKYVLTTPDQTAPIPATLDFITAAAVPEVFMTAYDALVLQGGLTLGQRVLTHAAGSGVGTAVIQLARAAGAQVWGTSRSDIKRSQAQALGATAVFDPSNFAADVQNATGGAGVDILIDFVGAQYLAANLDALASRGRMVIVGTLSGAKGTIDMGVLMRKRLHIMGTVLRSRTRAEKATLTRRFTQDVVPLFERGEIRPVVDRLFPLDDIVAAHRYMEANENFGKIILQMVT